MIINVKLHRLPLGMPFKCQKWHASIEQQLILNISEGLFSQLSCKTAREKFSKLVRNLEHKTEREHTDQVQQSEMPKSQPLP